MELGLNYMRAGAFTEARQWFDECKTYSSYALETIVHFRIHTAIRTMSLVTKAEKKRQKQQQQQQQQLDSINEDEAEGDDGEELAKSKAGGGFGSIWSALSRRWNGNTAADAAALAGETKLVTPEVIAEVVEVEVEEEITFQSAVQNK